jgi:hypothetical protein
MEAIGWEMQPAGWILLVILIVVVANYIIGWLPRRSDENQ